MYPIDTPTAMNRAGRIPFCITMLCLMAACGGSGNDPTAVSGDAPSVTDSAPAPGGTPAPGHVPAPVADRPRQGATCTRPMTPADRSRTS